MSYTGDKEMCGITTEIHYIFSILKGFLFLTILTVINFSTAIASNENLSADFPSQVYINSEFNVSINYLSEEKLDVKIFVHNSSDEKVSRNEIISEIFDSDWKDSWLYILGAFPSKTSFTLRINSFSEKVQLCVQLRKVGKSAVLDKFCSNIELISDNSESSDNSINKTSNSEIILKNNENEVKTSTKKTVATTARVIEPVAPANITVLSDPFNNQVAQKNQTPIIKTKIGYLEKATLYLFLIF